MQRNKYTFSSHPADIDIKRSKINKNCSVKTSFNVGDLIPFYVDEVLPGETRQIKTSEVVRLQTLVTPVMDNIFMDIYYFYVPSRILWSHWREFMGENTTAPWIQTTTYTVPQITSPSGGWNVGTIADYFGIPTGVDGLSVNALPFRAYAMICNEWFRDENLTTPCNVPLTDATVTGSNGGTYVTDVVLGGKPFKAAKMHDYFTSCLRAPQKGPDVTIPLGTTAGVFTSATDYPFSAFPRDANNDAYPIRLKNTDNGGVLSNSDKEVYLSGYQNKNGLAADSTPHTVSGEAVSLYPSNLYADLTNATAASINQLRLAFQIQKFYERAARGGTRYREMLKSHFGVTSPDARMQIPEYLGGSRCNLNVNQVVQNSESGTTPQGHVAAYSQTNHSHGDFIKSFTEHGYIMGLAVVRYDHTYQNGVERMWSRKSMFDFYFPEFANIGEQSVLNKEIFAQGLPKDNETFGYQEAWAEYRYKPSHVTGEMRSSYAQSLDSWHLADDYSTLPSLSDAWIREDKSNVDRCLAVQSSVSNQCFADIYVQSAVTLPMPLYSIPGLMDHH